jgi:hypothetical protein
MRVLKKLSGDKESIKRSLGLINYTLTMPHVLISYAYPSLESEG